jgi:threonine/homoserine/homoserine lactone efflux protein
MAFAHLAFCVLGAAFLVYFGWVGLGPWRYRLDDDIRQHRENRERFRWPW